MRLPAQVLFPIVLALHFCPMLTAASSLEIYKGDSLIAKIPKAYYQRIANKKLIVDQQNCSAISLTDLLQMLHLRGENVILAGAGYAQTVAWLQLKEQNIDLCFHNLDTVRSYSNSEGLSPVVLERITVTKENYFPPRFIVLICSVLLLLILIFHYQQNILIRSAALFVTSFLIYQPFDLPTVGNYSDNFWYVPTSLSLLTQGNFELSEWRNISNLDRPDYRIINVHGLPYCAYPLGTSLLTLPLVFAGSLIYPESIPEKERVFKIAAWVAKIVAALSVAFLFVLAFRLTGITTVSLFLTFLFAFATNHFNTHAGGLWSHNTGSLLILIGLLFLTSENDRSASLSSIPLGLAYITRPTYIIVILIVTIYVFFYRRRALPAYLVWGGIIAVAFFSLNYVVYDRFLTFYQTQRPHLVNFAEALAGNLISPNRGLFIFAPIFLWSVYGIYLSWAERDKIPHFYRLLSVLVVAHWVMISPQAPNWSAGYYIGPRKFCDVLPVWVLLLIPAIRKIQVPSLRANWILIPFWIVTIGWSLFVQFRSVTNLSVYQWNHIPVRLEEQPSRVWDWTDWQVIREERPKEGLEVYCNDSLSARIPEGLFNSLATVKIPAVKGNVLPVQELAETCSGPAVEFLFRGSGRSFSLYGDQAKDCYLYFSPIGKTTLKTAKLFSPSHHLPKMPEGLRQITIK